MYKLPVVQSVMFLHEIHYMQQVLDYVCKHEGSLQNGLLLQNYIVFEIAVVKFYNSVV